MSREQDFHSAEWQAERFWQQDCPLPPISLSEAQQCAESALAWAWEAYGISPGFEVSDIHMPRIEGTRAQLEGRFAGIAQPHRSVRD